MSTSLAVLMQSVVFAGILIVVLRFVGAREDRYSSAMDRLAADANVTARRLIETVEAERAAKRDEIQVLLQRIQAPEHAVVEHAIKHSGPEPNGMPRTETESAEATDEMLAARRIVEEIEQMERDEQISLGLIAG